MRGTWTSWIRRNSLRLISEVKQVSGPTLVVLTASLGYSILLSDLSILKYESFNATFGDLGLNNHVLWLLSHGGLTEYYQSGFSSVYAFNYQKPIYLIFAPFYALDPTIQFLLVTQSFFLGFAAVPLYLMCRRTSKSEWISALVATSYLVYFPIAGANLFDWHEMSFLPMFFFAMLYFWVSNNRTGMYVAGVLYSTINPLTLLTFLFFIIYEPLEKQLADSSRPFFSRFERYLRVLYSDRLRIGVAAGLVATLLFYVAIGSLPTAGASLGTTNGSLVGNLLVGVNSKLTIFLFLFGALAFLPLFDRLALVTLLPYAAFVFASSNSANWAIFGLAYPLMAVGPLYLGVTNVLARDFTETSDAATVAPRSEEGRRRDNWRKFNSNRSGARHAYALVAIAIVFGLVYFPGSPVNPYVSGGYFSGNHNLANITYVGPDAEFLDRVIGLIPPSAGVLTQNDIPQVSGREYYVVDQFYSPEVPYNFLLMDSAFNYFSPLSAILPYATSDFDSGKFGIAAEGMGALLLEAGFNGTPQLYVPTDLSLTAAELTIDSAKDVNNTIVGDQPGLAMWYGPYDTLYPGNYSASFTLAINTTVASSEPVLTLQVTANQGAIFLDAEPVFPQNFSSSGAPTTFTLTFHVDSILTNVEFRGWAPTGSATLTLDQISVSQLSYK